jgi:hypothetical protein
MPRAHIRIGPATVRVRNVYGLVAKAVEDGIGYGYRRAHKHTETPDADTIKETIRQHVMNELCELLDFGDP